MKKNKITLITFINYLSITFIVLVAVLFFFATNISENLDNANKSRYDLTYNANRFMNGSALLTNEVRAYAATGDIVHYDNYMKEVNVDKNRESGVDAMKKIGITAEEQKIIDDMAALSNQLVPLEVEAMEKAKNGDIANAINYVYGKEYNDTITKINELKAQFLSELDTRSQLHIDETNRKYKIVEFFILAMTLTVVLLQILLGFVIQKRLVSPIAQIYEEMLSISQGHLSSPFKIKGNASEVALIVEAVNTIKAKLNTYVSDISEKLEKMANNNFDVAVDINYVGEFEPIKTSITEIVSSLNSSMREIIVATNNISNGADQVSFGAQALAQGATEQASSIEELSASITQISSQVKQNADNSLQANTIANNAAKAIDSSNEQMQMLMTAMNEINSKSAEISKIIKTIEDIAFQTNILALNAAVEAARAGVAGKGFAVVADEVRNLAAKSAEAAKDTTALIEASVASIGEGVKLAETTERDLLGAVESVKETTAIISNISGASNKQASSIEQVTVGVDQISAVVQTNSATSEESAAVSQELSSQANLLKGLVSKFTLQEK